MSDDTVNLPKVTLNEREQRLLLWTLLAQVCINNTRVEFWSAYNNDENAVLAVQRQMREELRTLTRELWPPPKGQYEDWPR